MIISHYNPAPALAPARAAAPPDQAAESSDHVSLGGFDSIGKGVVRGAKSLVPGALGGAVGTLGGMAAFYTASFGLRVASMAFEFPGVTVAGAVVGAVVSGVVEGSRGAASGDAGMDLASAAMAGAGTGALFGVGAMVYMWSQPF